MNALFIDMNTDTPCLQYALWAHPGHRPSTSPKQSSKSPSVGDKRWINLDQWYSLIMGTKVWILFCPPQSHDKGWESHPDEMEQSAVIECEVLEFADLLFVPPSGEPSRDETNSLHCRVRTFRAGLPFTPDNWQKFPHLFEMRGWIKVRCLRVIPLSQIPLHFPEGEAMKPFFRCDTYSSKTLLLEVEDGDETYEWHIRTRGSDSRVVLCSFDISRDPAQICNRLFHSSS